MKTFKISVYDDFFKKVFTGEFSAENKQKAIQEAKEYYAYELDTEQKEIQIVDVSEC